MAYDLVEDYVEHCRMPGNSWQAAVHHRNNYIGSFGLRPVGGRP
ncbi:hypothetical protein ACH470_22890 [Streptomyces bottropensis]